MSHSLTTKEKQHLCFTWSVVLFLVSYSLSLCTLSPLVHANAVHPAGQTQHSPAKHCARPFTAPQTTTPQTTTHERTTEPFCCELRGATNKDRKSVV